MTDTPRSAAGNGPLVPLIGAAEPPQFRSSAITRIRIADGTDQWSDGGARAWALTVIGTEPCSLDIRPKSVSVAECCRVTRRLVNELFELACIGHVLDLGPARRPQCHIRQISMYLCRVVLSLSYGSIGRAHGRDRSTVVHACAIVEDRRDDRAYDEFLERCERCLLTVFLTREAGHGEA